MKKILFVALVAIGTLLPSGRADPAADLDAAIRKLLAAPNFTWRVSYGSVDPDPSYSVGYAYHGKTEPGGLTVVMTARPSLMPWEQGNTHEEQVLIVYSGERSIAKVDAQWFTARELWDRYAARVTGGFPAGVLAAADALAKRPGARVTTWTDAGYIHTPRPDAVLAILADGLLNVTFSGGAFTAEIAEITVAELFGSKSVLPQVDTGSRGMRVRGPSTVTTRSKDGVSRAVIPAPVEPEPRRGLPSRQPRYENARGTATFWVRSGVVVKYELRVEAIGLLSANRKMPHDVTITTTVDDEGVTTVDWPAGATEKLRQ